MAKLNQQNRILEFRENIVLSEVNGEVCKHRLQ